MKIAFVSQLFDLVLPPKQSSVGIWIDQIARRMIQTDQVTVYGGRSRAGNGLSSHVPYEYHPIQVPSGRQFRRWNHWLDRYRSIPDRLTGFDLADQLYGLKTALSLRQREWDVIHVMHYAQLVPLIRRLNPRASIVLHMHGEWLSQLERTYVESRLEGIGAILGVSEYLTGKIRNHIPGLAGRCQTVFNGVDVERFRPGIDPEANVGPSLLFAGRVSPEKGVHDLIEAFCIAESRYPGLQLHLVGPVTSLRKEFIIRLSEELQVAGLEAFYDGRPYRQHLESRVSPKLMGQLHFDGFVPTEEMPGYYHRSDLLVNPSYSESFGMSLVEAMACEKPTVSTRVGGMVEIVQEGKTGLLAPAGQPAALAGAILRLLDDSQARREMGRAGRERAVELFSWERVEARLREVYRELQTG